MVDVESAILACERSGAIIRHRVTLERGEFDVRRLWLRKEVDVLIGSAQLESTQREVVRAALRRFVVGGNFTVVTADCKHNEVVAIGDIRELKGDPPPFIELRFKPPPQDLRLFGRFVGKDSLILTTHGMKSLSGNTGRKRLSVQDERKRCDDAFKSMNLRRTGFRRQFNKASQRRVSLMAEPLRPTRLKAPVRAMSDDRKLEVIAQFRDDVLSKLADAFFQVVKHEGWGKRDLAAISGINETAINHILAGRRKNLTVETIALLTRAMQKRPELTLHNVRPAQNEIALTKPEPTVPEGTSKPLQLLSKSASNAAMVEVR